MKSGLLRTLIPALLLIFLSSGCLLYELNAGHYHRYFDAGFSHLNAENYPAAKKSFATAIYYADVGHLGPEADAAARYNYAIATGHLGNFQAAEECFKQAQAFDEKAEGKDGTHASMRWFELARLYQAWGRNLDAIAAYEEAIPLAESHGALEGDPNGCAAVLSDYAAVLRKVGQQQKADSVEAQAKTLRDANPGAEPKIKIHYYPAK